MKNILYADLRDDLLDRLDNQVTPRGSLGEYIRAKKEAPVVLARACTRGMIELLRNIPHSAIEDLVQSVTLTGVAVNSNITRYAFPDQAISEREDGGIITLVVDGEEYPLEESISFPLLKATTMGPMYGGVTLFTADRRARRFYVSCGTEVSCIVLRKPHSIFAPSQNMFAGASLSCSNDANTDGDLVLSDGIGGSVTIALLGADSIAQMYSKIIAGVNADTDIAYNAVLSEDESFVQLYHKYTISENVRLSPSVVSGGTGTWAISDTGTYEIPVPYHYIDDVVRLSIGYLMDAVPNQDSEEDT